MGVVYSTLIRKVRRINVENRAMRAIEREAPVSAPRHPSTKQFYEDIIKDSPQARLELENKNMKLDKHLKTVYVTSTGMTPEVVRDKSLLPQNKNPVPDDEFGFHQPEVPKGAASLQQILKFLADHQGDPQLWTAATIAKQNKLDEKTVGNVIEHFKTFNLYTPMLPDNKGGMYSWKRLTQDIPTNISLGESTVEDESKEPKEKT